MFLLHFWVPYSTEIAFPQMLRNALGDGNRTLSASWSSPKGSFGWEQVLGIRASPELGTVA